MSEGRAPRDAPTLPEDPLASDALVVEWYRRDESRRLARIFVTGAAILLAGSVSAGLSLVMTGLHASLRAMLAALGALCTVAGPLSTIVGLRQSMLREDYLVLRTDGVLDRLGEPTRLFSWEDIERVGTGEGGLSVELHFRDGSIERITAKVAGTSHHELARRMEMIRRKAMFGLIRRTNPLR